MAIAGGAVPTLEIWLDGTNTLRTGYATHANGAIVEDDLLSVIKRIRNGERVYMLRQGCNYAILEFVIGNNLHLIDIT